MIYIVFIYYYYYYENDREKSNIYEHKEVFLRAINNT